MKTNFDCPRAFDIGVATQFYVSKSYKSEYADAPMNDIVIKQISEKPQQVYLSCNGKIWKQIPFPQLLFFENVRHEEGVVNRDYQHLHTEFVLFEKTVHIDNVFIWSYGPGTGQYTKKIYIDGRLLACCVKGGNSFGANWGQGKSNVVLDNFLLQFTGRFLRDHKKYLFLPSDEDFPLQLFVPIKKEECPLEIYDFTRQGNFSREKFLNECKPEEVKNVFYPAATNRMRMEFFESVVDEIDGHFLTSQALKSEISSQVFNFSCIYLHKGGYFFEKGKNSFDSNAFRKPAEILKNYFLFKYTLIQSSSEVR